MIQLNQRLFRGGSMGLFMILALFVFVIVGCGEKKEETTTTTKETHEHSEKEAGHADSHEGHKEGEAGEEGEEGEEGGEDHPLKLTDEIVKNAGITFMTVKEEMVSGVVNAPGRVEPAQNAMARIGSLISGRVVRIHKPEGSVVAKGTVVAEIEAFDVGQLKGEFISARAGVNQAKSALDRQQRLSSEGIGAKRLLEEAKQAHEQALAQQRAVEAKLSSLGISPSSLEGSTYTTNVTVRSPISGVISEQNVVVGQFIDPSTEMFEVVNTATVWVQAQVQPELARDLGTGAFASISGANGERATGKVSLVSMVLDQETRRAPVRITVDNRTSKLKPNTFVTVEIQRQSKEPGIAVPLTAVEFDEGKHYVYEEREPMTFVRWPVVLGPSDGKTAIVLKGLEPGEKIIEKGVFYLKSIRQKGELQEHEH